VEWRVFRARWRELRLKIGNSFTYYGFLTLKSAIIHNLSEKLTDGETSLWKTLFLMRSGSSWKTPSGISL